MSEGNNRATITHPIYKLTQVTNLMWTYSSWWVSLRCSLSQHWSSLKALMTLLSILYPCHYELIDFFSFFTVTIGDDITCLRSQQHLGPVPTSPRCPGSALVNQPLFSPGTAHYWLWSLWWDPWLIYHFFQCFTLDLNPFTNCRKLQVQFHFP